MPFRIANTGTSAWRAFTREIGSDLFYDAITGPDIEPTVQTASGIKHAAALQEEAFCPPVHVLTPHRVGSRARL